MAKRIKPLPTPDLNTNLSSVLLGQVIRAKRTQSQLRLEDAAALCGYRNKRFKSCFADLLRSGYPASHSTMVC